MTLLHPDIHLVINTLGTLIFVGAFVCTIWFATKMD